MKEYTKPYIKRICEFGYTEDLVNSSFHLVIAWSGLEIHWKPVGKISRRLIELERHCLKEESGLKITVC
jgi:hypothetical protein